MIFKFPVFLFLSTLLLFLSACATPPPPPKVSMSPSAPEAPPPTQAEASPEDSFPGIRFLLNGNDITLEELHADTIDRNQTVLLRVDPSVPNSRVTKALVKVHELGYLVGISAEAQETP